LKVKFFFPSKGRERKQTVPPPPTLVGGGGSPFFLPSSLWEGGESKRRMGI